MAVFDLRPREFVPKWNRNRDQPEEGRIRVFFRGFTCKEDPEIRRLRGKLGTDAVRLADRYQRRVEGIQSRMKDATDDDSERLGDELDALIKDQSEDLAALRGPIEEIAMARVVRVTCGDVEATGDDIMATLGGSASLVDEIATYILGSGDVEDEEIPFSESPSTGG